MGRAAPGERGFVGLTVLLAATLLFVVAAVGVVVAADTASTAARARAAADAAALAGMAESPLAGGSGRPDVAAQRLAAANDARLVRLDDEGWPLRLAVTTQADPSTALVRRFAGPVRASAAAALRPSGLPLDVGDSPAGATAVGAPPATSSRPGR